MTETPLYAYQIKAGDWIRFKTADGKLHRLKVHYVPPPTEITIISTDGETFTFAGNEQVTQIGP